MLNESVAFIGRLHPLWVHLPIAFLLMAIVFDLLAYRSAYAPYRSVVSLTLLLGFGAAIMSCISGYLLSGSGDYAPQSLLLHQWGGFAVAGFSGLLWTIRKWLYQKNQRSGVQLYSGLLLILALLLGYTGHQGGSLTHGDDYLSWVVEKAKEVKKTAVATPLEEDEDIPKVNPDLPLTVDPKYIAALRARGCTVRLMLKRPVMLDVTLPSQSGKKMADIVPALQAVAANIVLLNLADNGLIEQDLTFLKQLPNLEKLRLEKNPIGDGIGGLLLELEHLNAVNLNETKISKATLDILHQNPAIKRIYCWKTAAE